MSKYKNLKELSGAFKAGELNGWMLILDNDCTYLSYRGPLPDGIEDDTDASDAFESQKCDEGSELWDGNKEAYILDQALDLAGIPNEGC
jgi:hypothetical protein